MKKIIISILFFLPIICFGQIYTQVLHGDTLWLKNITNNDSIQVSSKQVGNYVIVKALSDFPAAVSNVITLADNATYQISGTIDLGSNRIVMGTRNSIIGF